MVIVEKSWERAQSCPARIFATATMGKKRMRCFWMESGFEMLEGRSSSSSKVSGRKIGEVVGWLYWHRCDGFQNVMGGAMCRPHHGAAKR